MTGVVIDAATPADAADAAAIAAEKRAEQEPWSPVFWRVADDAVAVHEQYLARCIEDPDTFTALAARREGRLVGLVLAMHQVFPPPLSADPEPSWLVDDLLVASVELWSTVGVDLLRATEHHAREGGAERLVVIVARRDEPKRRLLEEQRYCRRASWWVRPVSPSAGVPPTLQTTRAVVGAAPPVYDPGGPTALALELTDPAEVEAFTGWAARSGAVLAIVPTLSDRSDIDCALSGAGYAPASDWYVKALP